MKVESLRKTSVFFVDGRKTTYHVVVANIAELELALGQVVVVEYIVVEVPLENKKLFISFQIPCLLKFNSFDVSTMTITNKN